MKNETLLQYNINYSEELEEIQRSLFVRTIGLLVFIAYAVIVLFGVPANVYVLCRLNELARDDSEKYFTGSGAGLYAMATADLLSILSISLQNVLTSFTLNASDLIKSFLCKALIFTTHTATSVSIWSWLALSTLRYMAIRHPFLHLRLYRVPYHAIALYVFICSATNIWLLIAVYHAPSGCTQHLLLFDDGSLNRWFQLTDCIWSYCIPVSAIFYMDTIVLLCGSSTKKTGRKERKMRKANCRNKKKHSALRKCLIIAFIDLILNTPENLYRLVMLLYFPVITPNQYNFSARMIAQTLYFSQFAFNAVYLALFVYDKDIRPRTASLSSNTSISVEMKPVISSKRVRILSEVVDRHTAGQETLVNV